MASVKDLKQSKFLKKEDIGTGALVTITRVHQENVAIEGAEHDMKWCLTFAEFEKPMVLNSTNGNLIEQITGIGDNIETGWIGKQIVVFNDPTVIWQGKAIGGIRVRARKDLSKPEEILPF